MGDPRLGGSYIDDQGVLWIYDFATGAYVPATTGRSAPAPPATPPAMTPQAAPAIDPAANPYLPTGGQGWAEQMGGVAPTSAPAMPDIPAPPPPPVPSMAAPAPPERRSRGPVTTPTGAAAGPDGYVRRPRNDMPSFGPSPGSFNPTMGGGSASRSADAGGGGGSGLYQAFRSRIEGKLGGMMGGTGTDPAATEAAYRRSQQRQRQDTRQYEREQAQRSKFGGMYGAPIWFADGIFGQETPTGAGRDYLQRIPAGQLALLSRGYDNGRFLKKPAAFGRTLTDVYGDIVGGADGYDSQTLLNNLFSAGRNSSLASLFQTAGYPEARYGKDGMYRGTRGGRSEWSSPTSQLNSLMDLLAAAYFPSVGSDQANWMLSGVEAQLDPWIQRQMMRKPGKYKSILDYARRNLTLY